MLVAETNAPPKPEDGKGIKGAIMKALMKQAGAGVASANRITLLRDTDGDGVADMRTVFVKGLNSPFGMALVGGDLYVADSDALIRFAYHEGDTSIATPGTKVVDLPAGPINHHWTKNVIASADGSKLYVTVGSNSNVGENGIDNEQGRAAIWEVDPKTGAHRVFASGLRNPNGMAWVPSTGALWTAVNERDELGSDLVPDYMTSVRDGGFYGWPYSYYGQHVDTRVKPQRPDLVARAIVPDYALGPHTASLGLAWGGDSTSAAARVSRRHVRRAARLVESAPAQRLPRHLRAVRERRAVGTGARRADPLRRRERRRHGTAGRRRDRQARRAAGRRRRRQRRVARDLGGARHDGIRDARALTRSASHEVPSPDGMKKERT